MYEEIILRGIVIFEEKLIFFFIIVKVKSVFIRDGDYIKKGDLIVFMDDISVRFELKKKEREK